VTESAIDLAAHSGAIVERAELTPPTLHARRKRIREAALEREDDAVRAATVRSSATASTGPSSRCLLEKNAARDGELQPTNA
jgi:hypothetical protein